LEAADDLEAIGTRPDQQDLTRLRQAVDQPLGGRERELRHPLFPITDLAREELGAEKALPTRSAGAAVEMAAEEHHAAVAVVQVLVPPEFLGAAVVGVDFQQATAARVSALRASSPTVKQPTNMAAVTNRHPNGPRLGMGNLAMMRESSRHFISASPARKAGKTVGRNKAPVYSKSRRQENLRVSARSFGGRARPIREALSRIFHQRVGRNEQLERLPELRSPDTHWFRHKVLARLYPVALFRHVFRRPCSGLR